MATHVNDRFSRRNVATHGNDGFSARNVTTHDDVDKEMDGSSVSLNTLNLLAGMV